jgi:hypothetical protein
MIQLSESQTIARSPGEVFAFLADLNNFPKWRANLVSFRILTEGPGRSHACDRHLRRDRILARQNPGLHSDLGDARL